MSDSHEQHSDPSKGRIVLGVTGGIAAYKTAELVRLLTVAGHDVVPIMTPWATRFLGPLTLESLTGHQVRVETPTGPDSGIEHISLIRSAGLLLIAPLTANTMAKMVHGLADNFLTATYLAHRGTTMVCPAMNTAMLTHPATQRNLTALQQDGVHICMGEAGSLACGEVGAGRMAEPAIIADFAQQLMTPKISVLEGRRVLISAGPTREDLDPVRYLTNRSSGKMGFALAIAFRNAGAQVTLVHGPVNIAIPPRIEAIAVNSAAQMAQQIQARASNAHMVIMAAAVADYRPGISTQKLKKDNFDGTLQLQRTTDILVTLGQNKPPVLAGFAAESQNLEANAREKLSRKNLDMIFANDISGSIGFGSDDNHILAINRQGQVQDLGIGSKSALAQKMVSLLAEMLPPEVTRS